MLAFETERLCACPVRAEDEALFCRLYSDAETMRHIGDPLTARAAAARFQRIVQAPAGAPYLFTLNLPDGNAVGLCGVVQVCVAGRRAEVGMMLLPSDRSRGYATEVLSALTGAAFAAFPIDRVWVQYAPAHRAAERLVVRVGFQPCPDGEIGEKRSDNLIWTADRSSWKASNIHLNEGKDQCLA
jgi:RimJ/RimL family protein N-acetyltransferase